LASDERLIRGYSSSGGYIDLGVDFYKSMSHAFIDSFDFDLKGLMPFMCVSAKMDPACFSNICFIDTPGYNPPATAGKFSQGDERTAIEYAQRSDAIVWIIGLDVSGTVPDSDLEFIQKIGVDNRAVYVVLNKADLKSVDDIEDIIDEVESVLKCECIEAIGICAYSSTLRKVISHRGKLLMDYFFQINQQGNTQQRLEERLATVFNMYDEAIQFDINAIREQKIAMNGFRLDALEIGGIVLYEKMLKSISKVDKNLDSTTFEQWLKDSQRLRVSFTDAIHQTIKDLEGISVGVMSN
jgi:GTP-binding protein EngB required for normal cell division